MNELIAFYDDMVPPARLVAQMDGLGVRIEPVIECLPSVGVPCVVLGRASPTRIQQGLSVPSHGFVEWNPVDHQPASQACLECAGRGGLALALNTRMAYQIDVAQQFTLALLNRFPTLEAILGDIELSLAEAVANAIIHGNLGIGSKMRNDFQGFALFQSTLLERLEDPHRASRRIEITAQPMGSYGLKLSVTDQGDGYDIDTQMQKSPRVEAKSGRGLGLIRQLAADIQVASGGRTLTMDFRTAA
jgi:anti-sigma regulatory factor (Ser/Thr protein kinase)